VPNMELPFYFDQRGEINREMAEAAALDNSKHGGALDTSKHGGKPIASTRRAARMSKEACAKRRLSKEGSPQEYSGYMTAGPGYSHPAMTAGGPGPVPSLISNELINMKLDLMLQHQMRMFPPPSSSSLTEAEEREKQHQMRKAPPGPSPSSSYSLADTWLAEAQKPQPAPAEPPPPERQ